MTRKLFIYPQDDVKLPEEFHFSHNLCVRLYDDLVWILKDEKTQKKVDVNIPIVDKTDFKEFEDTEDVLEWLQQKGYSKEVNEIVSKHLVMGVISDICHFIYQALDSSKNFKLVVALHLVRKPFLENLLIIEQLLTEESEFLDRFASDSKEFDPGKISDDKKLMLIKESIKKVYSNYFLSHELIYDLRWDKNNVNSIYAQSNMATHLVTTRKTSYKTENQNLNFVFSGIEELDTQLQYFYYFVPTLLYYLTEVVDQYLLSKKVLTLYNFKERKFLRLMGQMLQHDQFDEKSIKGKSSLNKIVNELHVKCKNCKRKNQFYKSDIYSLVHDEYILCKFCLHDLFLETESMKEMIRNVIKK